MKNRQQSESVGENPCPGKPFTVNFAFLLSSCKVTLLFVRSAGD